ncbi:MAG: hypothetical protein OXI39_10560 [Gemmatimonadota bacterium]|uniref:hypothetical protein n=1 Tax=Candidatus Palauibacter scopulicola TaxID=3056741 RepID=UPI00239D8F96|nr:hypothetical protein [Candidatus Palauibacter scopulicola]MDE2663429.1 hypothetical protein [Candidatus Palauibacter scopulicola]
MPPVRGLRARVRARVRACVRAGFALAALAASPVALFAQTPLTAVGLGYPVAPVDGRSAALGGSGSGLLGGSYSVTNPADLLLHAEPGFSVSLASEGVTLQGDGPSLDTGRGRFTTIRALVPYNDWAFSLAFGGEFDQDWSNILQDTLRLNDGAVPYEETREHNGGISTIDASLARRLGPLGVGISAQRLTGSLRQSFFRQFDDPIGGAPALGGIAGARELSWRAWRFRAGGSIRLGDRVVAGVSLGTGGTLYATPEAAEEPEAEFDLPTSIELGGSVRVTDQILVTAGGGRAGWSAVGSRTAAAGSAFQSHDIAWLGGGVEYGALSLLGGRLPLRAGWRRTGLPFSRGAEALEESAFTGGFGWEFQEGLAVFDLAFESGSRGDVAAAGFAESFRRVTLSFSLRQR